MWVRVRRLTRLVPAALLVMAVLAEVPQRASADEGAVSITGSCAYYDCTYAYSPSSLTLTAGSGVTFTNDSSTAHTVTSDSGAFDSGNLAPGAQVRISFPAPGTYPYHCAIHPYLRGTIEITALTPTSVPATVVPDTPATLPTATVTSTVSPTPAATVTATPLPTATATAIPLVLAAHWTPRTVARGGTATLSVLTLPGTVLTVRISRPGRPALVRHGTATVAGTFTVKLGHQGTSRRGTVKAQVTATLGDQVVSATASVRVK